MGQRVGKGKKKFEGPGGSSTEFQASVSRSEESNESSGDVVPHIHIHVRKQNSLTSLSIQELGYFDGKLISLWLLPNFHL